MRKFLGSLWETIKVIGLFALAIFYFILGIIVYLAVPVLLVLAIYLCVKYLF